MVAAEESVRLASLVTLLAQPTPSGLWQLRGDLLQLGVPVEAAIWVTLDEFYHFLNELHSTASAREYSHFASLLDIGAVGGLAVQNLLAREGNGALWQRLLAGGLSESLMVLAARQYVKAWEGEMAAHYRTAAWNLYGALWEISVQLKPELTPATRRAHIDRLLALLHDEDSVGTVKAVLIARLYQLILLTRLRQLVPAGEMS